MGRSTKGIQEYLIVSNFILIKVTAMARDYFDLGSAPPDEDCAQVGSEGYTERVRRECRIWRDQITRTMTPTLRLGIKVDSGHDAGTQYYVVCYYDPDIEAELEEMLRLESGVPEKWDEVAREELERLAVS